MDRSAWKVARMKAGFTGILVAVCMSLAACAQHGVLEQREIAGENDVYLLDTGDKLSITVIGQAHLIGDFAVDGAG